MMEFGFLGWLIVLQWLLVFGVACLGCVGCWRGWLLLVCGLVVGCLRRLVLVLLVSGGCWCLFSEALLVCVWWLIIAVFGLLVDL